MIVMIVPHIETMPCYATTTTTTGIKHAVCRAVPCAVPCCTVIPTSSNRETIATGLWTTNGLNLELGSVRFDSDSHLIRIPRAIFVSISYIALHCFALQ
mmetsp:Transcript_17326/g.36206  ORF Transcript_17326/g.36206 Transcript_17326/m.36206 type:complete len:99 (-) Transcript_17326:153-449(-)